MPFGKPKTSPALGSGLAVAVVLVLFRGCGSGAPGGGQPGSGGPFGAAGCMLNVGVCAKSSDCCSQVCTSGNCQCENLGESCSSDDDCCTQWQCNRGTCTFGCRADGAHCGDDSECCGGACLANVCGPPRCLAAGEMCKGGGCCDGLSCVVGADAGIGGSYGTCQAGCSEASRPCGFTAAAAPCCAGSLCQDDLCVGTCRGAGLRCTDDNQCCDGFACKGGTCQACFGAGGSCKADGNCCSGTCLAGKCACQTMGGACSSDSQCCTRLRCIGGACDCRSKGSQCAADSDCCDGLTCTDGWCRPIGCFGYGQTCTKGTGATQCCDTCGDTGRCCISTGVGCSATEPCCGVGDQCIAGKCVPCHGGGGTCSTDADCCGGHCESGTCCVADRGAACGLALGGGVPCCAGLECGYTSTVCCQGASASCSGDSDCCTGSGWGCHGGRCCATPGPYSQCMVAADCCPGSMCVKVASISACCLPAGTSCTTGVDFCCGGQCAGGKCP